MEASSYLRLSAVVLDYGSFNRKNSTIGCKTPRLYIDKINRIDRAIRKSTSYLRLTVAMCDVRTA
eukprot:6214618-Pleurochrysis_carterae.AAC.1